MLMSAQDARGPWHEKASVHEVARRRDCSLHSSAEAGELPGIWILYPNRRLLRRTRLFVDELAVYVRDEL